MTDYSRFTDRERLDWLDRQHWTRWCGYGFAGCTTTWPVFSGSSYRDEIDMAMMIERYAIIADGLAGRAENAITVNPDSIAAPMFGIGGTFTAT